MATILGTPVQFIAIQYNGSAINSTFTKFITSRFFFVDIVGNVFIQLCRLLFIVKVGVVLDYSILRVVSNCLSSLFTYMRVAEYFSI